MISEPRGLFCGFHVWEFISITKYRRGETQRKLKEAEHALEEVRRSPE